LPGAFLLCPVRARAVEAFSAFAILPIDAHPLPVAFVPPRVATAIGIAIVLSPRQEKQRTERMA
jgi:hypothetical protein